MSSQMLRKVPIRCNGFRIVRKMVSNSLVIMVLSRSISMVKVTYYQINNQLRPSDPYHLQINYRQFVIQKDNYG